MFHLRKQVIKQWNTLFSFFSFSRSRRRLNICATMYWWCFIEVWCNRTQRWRVEGRRSNHRHGMKWKRFYTTTAQHLQTRLQVWVRSGCLQCSENVLLLKWVKSCPGMCETTRTYMIVTACAILKVDNVCSGVKHVVAANAQRRTFLLHVSHKPNARSFQLVTMK